MLSKFIQNIRAKPESVRRGITLGASLGITGIIGFFWLISFLNYSTEVLTSKPKVESPTSFLGKMSTLIGESYANVRAKMGNESNGFVRTGLDDGTTTSAVSDNTMSEFASSTDDSTSSTDSTGGMVNESDKSDRTDKSDFQVTNGSNVQVSSSSQNSKSLSEILNTKK